MPHVMNALQGHTEQGMAGRYGDGKYRLEILKQAIGRIEYPEWDFGNVSIRPQLN